MLTCWKAFGVLFYLKGYGMKDPRPLEAWERYYGRLAFGPTLPRMLGPVPALCLAPPNAWDGRLSAAPFPRPWAPAKPALPQLLPCPFDWQS